MTQKTLVPTVTRILEFDAGHRVHNHESKCATAHGHRYKCEVTARADALDQLGRVIDFSVLKEKIGGWLDREWDHNFIVYEQDKLTVAALHQIPRAKEPWVATFNPTAENMAHYLLHDVCPLLLDGTGVVVTRIKLWETPNCCAEAVLEETHCDKPIH